MVRWEPQICCSSSPPLEIYVLDGFLASLRSEGVNPTEKGMFCADLITAQTQFDAMMGVKRMGDGRVKVAATEDRIGMCEHPSLQDGHPGGAEIPVKTYEGGGLKASQMGAACEIWSVGKMDEGGFVVIPEALIVGQGESHSGQ